MIAIYDRMTDFLCVSCTFLVSLLPAEELADDPGDVRRMAFATTNTASASAALAWIFFDGMRGQKPSALGACVGAVVGLVAITPAAGYVSIGASIFIGTVASVVSNLCVHWKNKASSIDDTRRTSIRRQVGPG